MSAWFLCVLKFDTSGGGQVQGKLVMYNATWSIECHQGCSLSQTGEGHTAAQDCYMSISLWSFQWSGVCQGAPPWGVGDFGCWHMIKSSDPGSRACVTAKAEDMHMQHPVTEVAMSQMVSGSAHTCKHCRVTADT